MILTKHPFNKHTLSFSTSEGTSTSHQGNYTGNGKVKGDRKPHGVRD